MKGGVSEETVWAIVEAYLFETGKAASLEDFVKLFRGAFTEEELDASLERMERNRWQEGRGVILVARKGMWALEVRGKASVVAKLKMEKEEGLSQNDWSEGDRTVLAIIAYEGPVKLDRIEQIMGNDCSHYVILLQERGLIKKKAGKLEVTPTFYGFFGFNGQGDLPSINEQNEAKKLYREGQEYNFEEISLISLDETFSKDSIFDPIWMI